METLKFPMEKAVAEHRRRLNVIASNDTGPRPARLVFGEIFGAAPFSHSSGPG
jgi:hypothetical protein